MPSKSIFHRLKRVFIPRSETPVSEREERIRFGATAGRGFLFLLFVVFGVFPAAAQNYSFRVPKLQMYVTVRSDASVRIDYRIEFQNQPRAHVINVVDIGTPTAKYDLKNVEAWIGDQRLRVIKPSEYVDPGFEVHLGAGTILPGHSGIFRVQFAMPNMVFQDTTRNDYASLRITPTWFKEEFVAGATNIEVAIQLPKSVQPQEALHQGLSFSEKAKTKAGTVVYWRFPHARLTKEHIVAVSFPNRDMQRVVVLTKWDLLLMWFRKSPGARVMGGMIFFALFGWTFFRFSGGTGFSVFFVFAAVLAFSFILSPGWHLLAMPLVVVLLGISEWLLTRRRTKYMPPIAQIEGGGVKRGLTAPEAAVLLELPLAKVLMLVIFGMLKKGILRQVQAEPLIVEVDPAFPLSSDAAADEKAHQKSSRETAQKKGVVLHSYEQPFLFLLQNNPGVPVGEIHFTVPVRKLIEGAAARMAGFDLSDTKDYYRRIVARATEQAAAVGDIPQREATLDRNFEWVLMGDDYPRAFDYGRPYCPIWTRGGSFHGPSAPSAPSAPSIPGETSFSDVAASFSGWTENTLGGFASALSPEALSPGDAKSGFLDLSGADHVTGDIFKAISEASASGGSGGGGGCACAGCACACACAGGGR